ncbi:19522_t:CDS:2, partial [Cetraspora pellucida]
DWLRSRDGLSLIERAKTLVDAKRTKRQKITTTPKIQGNTQWKNQSADQYQFSSLKEPFSKTMEKSSLEIPSNNSSFLMDLLVKAHETLELKTPYEKRLCLLWEEFATFCKIHSLAACPALPILIFLLLPNSEIYFINLRVVPNPRFSANLRLRQLDS